LFAGIGSAVDEEMLADPLITVFPGTLVFSSTMYANVAVLALVMLALRVQVLVPVPPTGGFVQFHVPVPPVRVTETNVVLAGVLKVTVGVVAVFGPLLMTTTVKVILPPGETGLGAAVFDVTARSACAEAVGASAVPTTHMQKKVAKNREL